MAIHGKKAQSRSVIRMTIGMRHQFIGFLLAAYKN